MLTILVAAVGREDALHQLLLWEVREQPRPDVAAGLPARLVAHTAVELGLDHREADELAATLAGERNTRADPTGAAQRIADALRAGQLHEARDLLADLPPGDSADLRARVDAAWREVDELVRQADEARGGGHTEEAARQLSQAADLARDDVDIPARLAQLPPPPPTGTAAALDGGQVSVRWTPGPALTGGVRFRVVRATGAAPVSSTSGSTVVETTGNEAADPDPPVAEPVFYAVFADRGGDTWSSGTASVPIEVLPKVSDVALEVSAGSVRGSWRAHSAAIDVVVARTSRGGPAAARPVPTPDAELVELRR